MAPTVIAEITLSSSPRIEITMISVSGKRYRVSRIKSTVAIRQLQIGQQHLRRTLRQASAGFRQRRGGADLIARLGDCVLQSPGGWRVVFDQQNGKSAAISARRST